MSGYRNSSENSSFPNERIRIAAFSVGSTAWKLDWFGEIEFPNRAARRQQPSVLVYLSQVTDNASIHRHHENQRTVWVSIGILTLLRIGDIWRDGYLEARLDYALEEFQDLQIEKDTTSLIKAGLNLDGKGFLLPLSEHQGHRQSTQSYCLMVNLPEERKLIIPCMELIRFYFGSSSSLLTKLFLPPLTKKSLYENAYFDHNKHQLVMNLAEKISGASAADIGRIHMDIDAWRAAAYVGVSILKAATSAKTIHPQAFFPFVGITTLIASGQWCSFAGNPKSTFLVYSLRSCTHPFPFKSLRYVLAAGDANASKSKASQNRYKGANDANDQALVELDSSNNLASKTRSLRSEPRFIDLKDKVVWKSKVMSHENFSVPIGNGSNPVDYAAMGEGTYGGRIRPLEVAMHSQPEEWSAQGVPYFLRKFLPRLCRFRSDNPELIFELLTQNGVDGWTVPLLSLDQTPKVDSEFFNTQENLLSFCTCVMTLEIHARRFCLVIVDSYPAFIQMRPVTGLETDSIWEDLRSVPNAFCLRPESNLEDDDPLVPFLMETGGKVSQYGFPTKLEDLISNRGLFNQTW